MAKKMGRKKIELDWDQFNKLCNMQCTLIEIAGWFDCSEDTIERRVKEKFEITFAELYKKKSAKGKISLRRKQMDVAQSGNVSMLIWLGKQYLGQKDKREEETTVINAVNEKSDEEIDARIKELLEKK